MDSEVYAKLEKAIIDYDMKGATGLARKIVDEKLDSVMALNAMTAAMRQIGDGYSKGDLFLPDLVAAAEVLSGAAAIIEEGLKKTGKKREAVGKVVAGTVLGDIHSIGKTMLCSFFAAEGYDVYDLGVDVKSDKFMEATKVHKPNVIAMSALMTTTVSEQRNVIEALKREGLRDRVKILVGGGAVTQDFANEIGADGYDPTAPGAVKLVKKLLNK